MVRGSKLNGFKKIQKKLDWLALPGLDWLAHRVADGIHQCRNTAANNSEAYERVDESDVGFS